MRTHIFYHKRDLDGHCSGAVAKYYFMQQHNVPIMHPFDYGEPFPFDEIKKDDMVWMVDITTNPYETMKEIHEKCTLFVIDHHKSFAESEVSKGLQGLFLVGTAACELTWKHCFPGKLPRLVKLLGRYDVWDNSNKEVWNEKILPTQMGIKLNNTDPATEDGYKFWENYFDSPLSQAYIIEDEINKNGRIILKYQGNEDDRAIKLFSFPAIFENYKAICLNSTRFNSNVFKSVWDKEKYDIMLAWVRVKGEHFSVSLYTDKDGIDVSEIAKKYGGGGHKQAAGFQCEEVDIVINVDDEKVVFIIK